MELVRYFVEEMLVDIDQKWEVLAEEEEKVSGRGVSEVGSIDDSSYVPLDLEESPLK